MKVRVTSAPHVFLYAKGHYQISTKENGFNDYIKDLSIILGHRNAIEPHLISVGILFND